MKRENLLHQVGVGMVSGPLAAQWLTTNVAVVRILMGCCAFGAIVLQLACLLRVKRLERERIEGDERVH